jgi:hypothetical protein
MPGRTLWKSMGAGSSVGKIEPDRLDARLPFRWPQGETRKTPAFIVSVMSG